MRRYGFILFAALLVMMSAVSCDNGGSQEVLSKYLDSYSESVTSKSPVVVRFSRELPAIMDGVTSEELGKGISIFPKVPFKAVRTSVRTITITPSVPLENSRTYRVRIKLKKILSAKAEIRSLEFRFTTPPVRFDVTDGIQAVQGESERVYVLSGTVSTTDYCDSAKIEKGMKIDGTDASFKWVHSADGRTHDFSVAGIRSGSQTKNLNLYHDYTSMDGNAKGEDTFSIPAKGNFSIMNVSVVNEPLSVVITFSDFLDVGQDVTALVGFSPSFRYKYSIQNSKIRIFPDERKAGDYKIKVKKDLMSFYGKSLADEYVGSITIGDTKPSIKWLSSGNVLPSDNKSTMLFQSVNYMKAEIRVKRIYRSNVLQYLQYDRWEANYAIDKVAKVIADTTIILGSQDEIAAKGGANYGVNLPDLFKAERGCIYRVEIRGLDPVLTGNMTVNGYFNDNYFGDYSTYDERHCDVVASDLGIIAKGNANGYYDVFVTDLITGNPVSNVHVRLFNYVHQQVGLAVTDANGEVEVQCTEKAFAVAVNLGNDVNYLKLDNGSSLSTDNFDVGGVDAPKSIKAYLFGERGVWRPGDTIHITAVTSFGKDAVPGGYPVVAELLNPDGNVVQTLTGKSKGSGMYHFPFTTSSTDRTGRWKVRLAVGDETFENPVLIETVKPNRLKIKLKYDGGDIVDESDIKCSLSSEWLTGGPAAGLAVKADATVTRGETSFVGYGDYVFEDVCRKFNRSEFPLFEGNLDAAGCLKVNGEANAGNRMVPGFLNMNTTVRVFERSGDFSESSFPVEVSPFKTYLGMKLEEKKTEWGDSFVDKDEPQTVSFVALDKNGNKVSLGDAKFEVCRVDWTWWWSSTDKDLASYMEDESITPLVSADISLEKGSAGYTMDLSDASNGLYYFRISDPKGGHAAACLAEVLDSKSEGSSTGGGNGSTKLSTTIDKEKYEVGETARITIPSSGKARALLSLEKNGNIMYAKWINCKEGSTSIPVKITSEMLPNVYAFITLIQPHSSTLNDAPMRLYGVRCIEVEDVSSRLRPVISSPESVKPEKKLDITVSEKSGRAMDYVLEVVDEGLLGLTNFKTPDPWDHFFSKEALSIRTWDVYDGVIGAYGGKISRLFAIGGGESVGRVDRSEPQRFPSVVRYLGPFRLQAGKEARHRIDVPLFLGSLRVMVVASNGNAYGSASKDVKVTEPLMVQATLPRKVGTGEEIVLPVTVFTTEGGIASAKVNVRTDSTFTVKGESSREVKCGSAGEYMTYFTLVSNGVGMGRITVTADGGGNGSRSVTELESVDRTSPAVIAESFVLDGGESRNMNFALAGKAGTNSAGIEASSVPSMNIKNRLGYLADYPHGCVEQTVSSVFPLLYFDRLTDCDSGTSLDCEKRVKAAIRRLASFRNGDGSMSYWPGTYGTSEWGTAYAAHFLIEAKKCGYAVDVSLLNGTLKYLKNNVYRSIDPLTKAYFLYVMALGGLPQRGAMNGMREEMSKYDSRTEWMLAAAYAQDGQIPVAKEIIKGIGEARDGGMSFQTFGSRDRDDAVTALAYLKTNNFVSAFSVVRKLARALDDGGHFMSTQSIAWALYAVHSYIEAGGAKGGVDVSASVSGNKYEMVTDKFTDSADLLLKGNETSLDVELTNRGTGKCYITLSSKGIPNKGQERTASNGLSVTVSYVCNGISINPASVVQGTDFTATATVRNISGSAAANIVLTQEFPSGWEIGNGRLYDGNYDYPSGVSYQDFRDDRVYTYIDYMPAAAVVRVPVKLTATYEGRFYMPAVKVEEMYDDKLSATAAGFWTEVRRAR